LFTFVPVLSTVYSLHGKLCSIKDDLIHTWGRFSEGRTSIANQDTGRTQHGDGERERERERKRERERGKIFG